MRLDRPTQWATVIAVVALLSCATPSWAQDTGGTSDALNADAQAAVDAGRAAYKDKKYEEAIAAFDDALVLDPTNYDAGLGKGRAFEKLQKFEEAVKTYESLTTIAPNESDPYYRLGICYKKLKNYEQSVRYYRKTIEKAKDDPDPYYGLGESLQAMRDDVGALKAYQRYIELETRPEEQKYVQRAQELIASIEAARAQGALAPVVEEPPVTAEGLPEKPEAAIAGVDEPVAPVNAALADQPTEELVKRADMAMAAEDCSMANTLFTEVRARLGSSLELDYKLAVARACSGDMASAIDLWEACVKTEPAFETARENIHRAQMRMAVDVVLDDEALQGEADARQSLAAKYFEQGRYVMALRAARALSDLAPEEPAAHRLAARAHLGLADPVQARDALETELGLQPGDFGLYALMGMAYELEGDTSQAKYFYELYLSTVEIEAAYASRAEIRARIDQLSVASGTM